MSAPKPLRKEIEMKVIKFKEIAEMNKADRITTLVEFVATVRRENSQDVIDAVTGSFEGTDGCFGTLAELSHKGFIGKLLGDLLIDMVSNN